MHAYIGIFTSHTGGEQSAQCVHHHHHGDPLAMVSASPPTSQSAIRLIQVMPESTGSHEVFRAELPQSENSHEILILHSRNLSRKMSRDKFWALSSYIS